MHIAKLQEKKDKFKYGLGGLQGLQYGPPLRDHNYNGKGRFRFSCKFLQGYLKPRLNKLSKKKIICFIKQSMNKWKTNLYADGMLLGSVPIKKGIFQVDSFSPLLSVITLLPLVY